MKNYLNKLFYKSILYNSWSKKYTPSIKDLDITQLISTKSNTFKNNRKNIGEIFVGFGLLFLGLKFLKESVPNIKDNPEILEFLSAYTDLGIISLFLFIAVGVILTIVVQSSSAAMTTKMQPEEQRNPAKYGICCRWRTSPSAAMTTKMPQEEQRNPGKYGMRCSWRTSQSAAMTTKMPQEEQRKLEKLYTL